MLWSKQWQALNRWAWRLTWWQGLLLQPVYLIVVPVAGVCLCPKTTLVSVVVLVVVYAPLIHSGVVTIPWDEILPTIGRGSLAILGMVYLEMILEYFQTGSRKLLGLEETPQEVAEDPQP